MKNSLGLIILLFLTLVLFQSKSYGDFICATNADGAILVDDVGDGDITSFALATNPTVFDKGGDAGSDSCSVTPDIYKITLYKLGICTENPSLATPDNTHTNTVIADLSSCTTIYEDSAGKSLDLKPDNADIDLLEGDLVIPIGTYKYMFGLMSSHIKLKHIQKYIEVNSDGSTQDALITGYHPTDNVKTNNRGTVCYTGKDVNGNTFTTNITGEKQAPNANPAFTTLHGIALPTTWPGTPTKAKYRCGTLAEANAGNDFTTSIINNFGSRLWQSVSSVDYTNYRNAVTGVTSSAFPGITQSFYLLKDDNVTISDTAENARRILGVQDHDDPLIISENTVGLKLLFKTNNSISTQIGQEADAGGENRDEILMGQEMQAKSFSMLIQTKTRRARGAWR